VKTFGPSRFAQPAGAEPGKDFRQLILPHLDGAYNLARYLTRDPVLSEDVVQDAMLRAFRAFGQLRGGSPRAWLFAIVRNCSLTAQAGTGAALGLVVEEADPGPTPEDEAMRKDEIGRVRSAVEAMPEPFREAVVLRDLEDLSYAEIAEVTGVPIGTVMSRLSRGRSMLAKELLPASKGGDEQSRSAN
jgi:RNA polymerase sigma factor (sigma-70 family)